MKVADHLIWNLVNLLFCLGGVLPPAVGIYFSLEVSKARRRGDRKAAERASGLAAGAAILGTLGGLALLGFATLVLLAGMGA